MDLISQSDSFNGLCTGSSSISHFRQVFFGWSQFLFSIGFSYGVKTSSFINSFHLEHHLNHIAPVVKFLSEVFFFF